VRGYLVSPEANSDIIAIWRWIAKDSVDLADRVDTELHDVFEALARMPRLGHRREASRQGQCSSIRSILI
jgi:plasmid stabilization system protein ParE